MFGFFKKKKVAVQVDASSQSIVLSSRMHRADMTHDETVLATVPRVRIRNEAGKPVLYFCNMLPLQIHERISAGDGKSIPNEAKLRGIKIDKKVLEKDNDRYYNLKNVKLYSNGTIQVIATRKTELEPLVI